MSLQEFIVQLSQHCGVDSDALTVELVESDTHVEVALTLPEEESGRFIGYHGEALAALQRIARLAFEAQYPDKKIVLNVNGYREQRLAQLKEKTLSIAQRVVESGQPYTFHLYVPSHERYAIHAALSESEFADRVESVSDGEGRQRRLTVKLKEGAEQDHEDADLRPEPEQEPELAQEPEVALELELDQELKQE